MSQTRSVLELSNNRIAYAVADGNDRLVVILDLGDEHFGWTIG